MKQRLGFLIFPNFQILDAAGPVAAFEIAARFAPGAYTLKMVSRDGGLVPSSSGVMMASDSFEDVGPLDTLIIAGGEGTRSPAICGATLDFVRASAAAAPRIASVCSGAYVLAAAGLLDGRRATTHWRRTPDFQKLGHTLHPQHRVPRHRATGR